MEREGAGPRRAWQSMAEHRTKQDSLPGAEMPSSSHSRCRCRSRFHSGAAGAALLVALSAWTTPWTYAVTAGSTLQQQQQHQPAYAVPQPLFEALYPRGLRASIPDRKGITLIRLVVNINKPLTPQRTGSINVEVAYKTGSKWVYEDRTTVLRSGDTVSYWIQVEFSGKPYSRSGNYSVEDLVEIYDGSSFETEVATASQPTPRPTMHQSGHTVQKTSTAATQRPTGSGQVTQRPVQQSSSSGTQRPSGPGQVTQRPAQQSSSSGQRPTGAGQVTQRPAQQSSSTSAQRPNGPGQATQRPVQQSSSSSAQRPSGSTQATHRPVQLSSSSGIQRPSGSGQTTQRPVQQSSSFGTQRPSGSGHATHRPVQQSSSSGTQRPTGPNQATQRPIQQSSSAGMQRPTAPIQATQKPVLQTSVIQRPVSSTTQTTRKPEQEASGHATPRPHQVSLQATAAAQRPPAPPALPPAQPINNMDTSSWSNNHLTSGYDQTTQRQQPQQPRPASEEQCGRSLTSVNGKLVCREELVFLENFDDLGMGRWIHDVRIPGNPDHEFNVLTDSPLNTYTVNGQLVLRPTLTEDTYGADFVRSGRLQLVNCTAGPPEPELCSRQAKFGYILPPVMTGRISTHKSFSFRYGRIEIRAKLPSGDWLYPELWLRPRENAYGPDLQSGRIQVAMARGNQDLRSVSERTELGARRLEAAAIAASGRKEISRTELPGRPWSGHFHNYTLQWTPDALVFSVDGVELGALLPERTGGFLVTNADTDGDPWKQGGRMAPFDREFYISLGLGIGGIRNFPDSVEGSSGSKKPWKNTAAKAMLSFWNAKDEWYRTWDVNSALLVDFIRVTAL